MTDIDALIARHATFVEEWNDRLGESGFCGDLYDWSEQAATALREQQAELAKYRELDLCQHGCSPCDWALTLISQRDALRADAERIDFLQQVKNATFRALNPNIYIASIELFTVPSQHVQGNTVREVIDSARAKLTSARCTEL